MAETVESNLACLEKILHFNARHRLLFFRISSDLVPFASHPVCSFPWQKIFRSAFKRIGELIHKYGMRVSMHPDQFILINSPQAQIFHRSVKELWYHSEVLDLLETDTTAKIQMHVGGVYGNKGESIRRFIERYEHLPKKIKRRLVIENDERLYSTHDCLEISRAIKIPVVFDFFHYTCKNNSELVRQALFEVHSTWSEKDGLPIVDYSSQARKKKVGAHVVSIDIRNFRQFLCEAEGFDFDIMCEVKDKERSAMKARAILKEMNRID